MPVAIINSNNIADWCSNDRQILVTPSCFAVRPFLLTSLMINIQFLTSNKMAIIGSLPSRFSDKNQQLYKGSLIRACAYKLFIFPSKVSRLVTFKIMRVMVFNAKIKNCGILILTVTDEDYSRNASQAKTIIGKVVTSSQHTA